MDLQKRTGSFFKVKENSNYQVMLSYDRSEIIEPMQFTKLANVLNKTEHVFVTINNRIVKKDSIIDIAPTTKKTIQQKEEIEKAKRLKDEEDERAEKLVQIKEKFDTDFFNSKYGAGKWRRLPAFKNKPTSQHVLNTEDWKACNLAFEKSNKEKSKELDNIINK